VSIAGEGRIGRYYWGECVPPDNVALPDAVRRLKHHLNGLRAVNVSWDSGLLVPSDAEVSNGWSLEQGRAVSPVIDDAVTETWPSCDGGFEEWYFFSRVPRDLGLSAYCNWVGTSIAEWASLVDVPTGLDLRRQLETARPEVVLGEGRRLFAISRNRALIADFFTVCGERPHDSERQPY